MVVSGAPFRKRSIWAGEKLLTPIARIFPSRRKASRVLAVSSKGTDASGQWT